MSRSTSLTRRRFFKDAGLGAATFTGLPILIGSCSSGQEYHRIREFFSPGEVILFQGDSITDAGRNRERELPNDASSFGNGYAHLIACWLLEELAGMELTIYNRGISGNKVFQLKERWERDCLLLKPDVLSILIGVNDYWHMREGRYDGTPEVYQRDLRSLLERTREALPDIRLILCQPFILPDTRAVDQSWVEPFRAYQEVAANIAAEFHAVWVPFQEVFIRAAEMVRATYWTPDGVHPSMAGSQLMAETWLESIG